jgi:hypothetical protein
MDTTLSKNPFLRAFPPARDEMAIGKNPLVTRMPRNTIGVFGNPEFWVELRVTCGQGCTNIHIREYEHEIFGHIRFIFISANMNMNMENHVHIRSNFRLSNLFMNIQNNFRIIISYSFHIRLSRPFLQ